MARVFGRINGKPVAFTSRAEFNLAKGKHGQLDFQLVSAGELVKAGHILDSRQAAVMAADKQTSPLPVTEVVPMRWKQYEAGLPASELESIFAPTKGAHGLDTRYPNGIRVVAPRPISGIDQSDTYDVYIPGIDEVLTLHKDPGSFAGRQTPLFPGDGWHLDDVHKGSLGSFNDARKWLRAADPKKLAATYSAKVGGSDASEDKPQIKLQEPKPALSPAGLPETIVVDGLVFRYHPGWAKGKMGFYEAKGYNRTYLIGTSNEGKHWYMSSNLTNKSQHNPYTATHLSDYKSPKTAAKRAGKDEQKDNEQRETSRLIREQTAKVNARDARPAPGLPSAPKPESERQTVTTKDAAATTGYDAASLVRMARTGRIEGARKDEKGNWLLPSDKLPQRGQRARRSKPVQSMPTGQESSDIPAALKLKDASLTWRLMPNYHTSRGMEMTRYEAIENGMIYEAVGFKHGDAPYEWSGNIYALEKDGTRGRKVTDSNERRFSTTHTVMGPQSDASGAAYKTPRGAAKWAEKQAQAHRNMRQNRQRLALVPTPANPSLPSKLSLSEAPLTQESINKPRR